MNRKRLYENIMKDLRRAFRRSLNEDILDDIDINDSEEDNVTTKINKQNQEMVNQIADDAVQQMINEKKQLPEYIYNSEAVWKPENKEQLDKVINKAIRVYGNKVNLNWIDVSEITDMSYMFWKSEFNGDISKWDVSNITDMHRMFEDSEFNGDISQWNVSNVTDMESMFCESEFNGDISEWNVSNVTDMRAMFQKSKFNGDISQWDVSNVTNMYCMFFYSEFNGDISQWNVSNVTDMSYMFEDSIFNGDISKWNVSNVKNMESMFDCCPLENNTPIWYEEEYE